MARFKEHEAATCSIEGCKQDATWWFDTSHMPRTETTPRTFYLCPEHMEKVSPDEEYAYALSLSSGILWRSELASYSCHDDCPVCNG